VRVVGCLEIMWKRRKKDRKAWQKGMESVKKDIKDSILKNENA